MRTKHVNDDNDTVKFYLKDLKNKRFTTLPQNIEKLLFKKIKSGDKKSENQLIEAHLRMVLNIAKKFKGKGVEFSDLIQEGNLGLYEALKRFDESKNVRFCVYAEWWVKNFMLKALGDKITIENNEDNLTDLINKNNDHSEDREIDDLYYNSLKNDHEPLDDSEEENSDEYYSNTISMLMETLDDKMKLVVEHCYGINGKEQLTMVELAKKMGITAERVRQIKVRAMMALRTNALTHSVALNNY